MSITSAEFMRDPRLTAALFKHVVYCPPFGPFAHHSAVILSADVASAFGVHVSPAVAEALFAAHFDLSHFRSWPSLYVASELPPSDVLE